MILRKFLALSLSLTLCITTLGCGGNSNSLENQSQNSTNRPTEVNRSQSNLPNGQYAVQQVTFDDGSGEYTAMLVNTPPGVASVFRNESLPLARLTDEEVKAGQKAYLKVENNQPSLHIPEDFKIEYVHNVTENVTNPQTGQTETKIVRQEPNFWTPFAGALAGQVAGQAIGSLLFRPQHYVPPMYQPGVPLSGYGGYGSTYGQAVTQYRDRYQAPPAVERNRQVFRSTGRMGSSGYSNPRVNSPSFNSDRPTGSGYGTSTLRRSNGSSPTRMNRSGGFGSSRARVGGRRR